MACCQPQTSNPPASSGRPNAAQDCQHCSHRRRHPSRHSGSQRHEEWTDWIECGGSCMRRRHSRMHPPMAQHAPSANKSKKAQSHSGAARALMPPQYQSLRRPPSLPTIDSHPPKGSGLGAFSAQIGQMSFLPMRTQLHTTSVGAWVGSGHRELAAMRAMANSTLQTGCLCGRALGWRGANDRPGRHQWDGVLFPHASQPPNRFGPANKRSHSCNSPSDAILMKLMLAVRQHDLHSATKRAFFKVRVSWGHRCGEFDAFLWKWAAEDLAP